VSETCLKLNTISITWYLQILLNTVIPETIQSNIGTFIIETIVLLQKFTVYFDQ
jgi:hypothetical protein